MKFIRSLLVLVLIFLASQIDANEVRFYQDRQEVLDFVDMMNQKHGFAKDELIKLFTSASFQEKVIRIMNRQPEGVMNWTNYKSIMLTPERLKSGELFIKSYRKDLKRAEDIYGVPAEIIVSIIGIETRYGKVKGNIRVLDSLMTLSFDYPRRSRFFKRQLEEFLLLVREENLEISKVKGSIAGAMGYGQFMPDSYRDYAVDFDFDGKRDIFESPVDAIGSVANFLSLKGKWEPHTQIAIKAELVGERPKLRSAFKPYINISELSTLGIKPSYKVQGRLEVVPIELELNEGYEYWLGLKNFHSLSRYNRSKLYVMAVFEFSNLLADFL